MNVETATPFTAPNEADELGEAWLEQAEMEAELAADWDREQQATD
jgi:hypothetical protein